MQNIKQKIALYWIILGVALSVIPLFNIVATADGANGAIITIDATNRDLQAIKNAVELINSDMIAAEIGNCGRSYTVNGKTVVDSATAEAIILNDKGSVVDLAINNRIYGDLSMKEKEEFMRIALNDIQNSSISVINRNKIYSFIANSDKQISGLVRQLSEDVSVDMPGAYSWFKPLSGPVGIILGVITIGIFALLGISTVIDISFLTIPGVQYLLIHKCSDKEKPPLVSLEAWDAYKEAVDTHKGVLGLFFQKKAGQMIVLGICLLYLVSGNLFALVAKVVDYFQGLTDLIVK